LPELVDKSQVSLSKVSPKASNKRMSASNVKEDEEMKSQDGNFADGFDFDINIKKKHRMPHVALKDNARALKNDVKEKVRTMRKDIKEKEDSLIKRGIAKNKVVMTE